MKFLVNVVSNLRRVIDIRTIVHAISRYNILIFYCFLSAIVLTLTNEVRLFRAELQEFRGSVVYDIDKVRLQYITDASYMYTAGCNFGTDYPEEFRVSQSGFNTNSPMMYCDRQMKDRWEEYIYEQASKIGRK